MRVTQVITATSIGGLVRRATERRDDFGSTHSHTLDRISGPLAYERLVQLLMHRLDIRNDSFIVVSCRPVKVEERTDGVAELG